MHLFVYIDNVQLSSDKNHVFDETFLYTDNFYFNGQLILHDAELIGHALHFNLL